MVRRRHVEIEDMQMTVEAVQELTPGWDEMRKGLLMLMAGQVD
jgi:hypothetical protein